MSIALGNLSINEFIRRTGYNISKDDIFLLNSHRQDNATVAPNSDKFHIFDMPFSIVVGENFKTQLINILTKYESISPSKEICQVSISVESEKDRLKREKREQEKKEWEEKLNNPKSIWLVKWNMLVPVKVYDSTDKTKTKHDAYYGCMINTYTTGVENIPDIIDGTINVYKDEEGVDGHFKLNDADKNNDADEFGLNVVVGLGFYTIGGRYIDSIEYAIFDETNYSIKDGLENWTQIHGDNYKYKLWHSYSI